MYQRKVLSQMVSKSKGSMMHTGLQFALGATSLFVFEQDVMLLFDVTWSDVIVGRLADVTSLFVA